MGGKAYFRVDREQDPVSVKDPSDNKVVRIETNESSEKLFLEAEEKWLKRWKTLIHGIK